MFVKGDKAILVKPIGFLTNIGEVYNVEDVSESGVISCSSNDGKQKCTMSSDLFDVYFKKVKEEHHENTKDYSLTAEDIDEILENSEFDIQTIFDKCTVVTCKLPNGFVVTESYACVNPDDYDEEAGFGICYDKIVDKVWELEAYRLQNELYVQSHMNGMVDCDNCNDYDCPNNTRS